MTRNRHYGGSQFCQQYGTVMVEVRETANITEDVVGSSSASYLPRNQMVALAQKGQGRGSKGGSEMEWQVIVALVVAIPIILFPVAFLWYLNVSGLYRVIWVTRARQKRRAETLAQVMGEAEAIVQGTATVGTAGK